MLYSCIQGAELLHQLGWFMSEAKGEIPPDRQEAIRLLEEARAILLNIGGMETPTGISLLGTLALPSGGMAGSSASSRSENACCRA